MNAIVHHVDGVRGQIEDGLVAVCGGEGETSENVCITARPAYLCGIHRYIGIPTELRTNTGRGVVAFAFVYFLSFFLAV